MALFVDGGGDNNSEWTVEFDVDDDEEVVV
jgi:hypothetical protein